MSTERTQSSLEAFLRPDEPTAGKLTLRNFSGATMAMMRQTHNEWLKMVPADQMENPTWATLCWLFIQAAPEATVRRVIWQEQLFRESVLEFGTTVEPEELAEAEVSIQHALGLVKAATVEVVPKPGQDGQTDDPPPNS